MALKLCQGMEDLVLQTMSPQGLGTSSKNCGGLTNKVVGFIVKI